MCKAARSRARRCAGRSKITGGRFISGTWQLFASHARTAARGLLDAVLPPTCLACDEAVDVEGQLCAGCFQRISLISEPMCRCCGVPFTLRTQGGRSGECPDCEESPRPFHRARAPFRYDLQSRPVVLALKHYDRPDLAEKLARHMIRAGAELLAEADLLIPVPLHRRRLLYRTYNQAALLAQAVSRLTGVAVLVDALVRHRSTVPLGGYDAVGRARILRDAIAVRPRRFSDLAGRRVVLVDDVLTTGATVGACAIALLDADVAAVDVLAAARVPNRTLDQAI
jgi:ComF family protein